jgi:hypothetical protein
MAFRELILTNFRRKLFSFLLAILIWTTIHFADKERRQLERANPQTNSMTF